MIAFPWQNRYSSVVLTLLNNWNANIAAMLQVCDMCGEMAETKGRAAGDV